MKSKRSYIISAIISVVFLILISVTAIVLGISLKKSKNHAQSVTPDEVFIYITETEASDTEKEKFIRTVKEHNGQIGIFDGENKLQRLLDIYVKTLPKADRDQLREGITVNSEKELYSIIEAYSD